MTSSAQDLIDAAVRFAMQPFTYQQMQALRAMGGGELLEAAKALSSDVSAERDEVHTSAPLFADDEEPLSD